MIADDFAKDQERIRTVLKEKADAAKLTNRESHSWFKPLAMYPASTHVQTDVSNGPNNSIIAGAVLPQGFKHYPHCACYEPDPSHPKPTMELAHLDMLSE